MDGSMEGKKVIRKKDLKEDRKGSDEGWAERKM
jgi:hypothetical protein